MVKDLISAAVESALPDAGWMPNKRSDFLVNPTGNFVVGGPTATGSLTGRKIIVDTSADTLRMAVARSPARTQRGRPVWQLTPHATSPTNVVAAGVAERCTIQVAYAIGVAGDPMSLLVDTHGTRRG